MNEQLSQEDLEIIKKNLIESLYIQDCLKTEVPNNCPDYLKPYADINPFSEDAEEQIAQRMSIIHPETIQSHPVWIQNLIDKGLVDEDGKTVIAKSLGDVAAELMDNGITVTNIMLQRFLNGKTGNPYSDSSINQAIFYANTK